MERKKNAPKQITRITSNKKKKTNEMTAPIIKKNALLPFRLYARLQ